MINYVDIFSTSRDSPLVTKNKAKQLFIATKRKRVEEYDAVTLAMPYLKVLLMVWLVVYNLGVLGHFGSNNYTTKIVTIHKDF